MEDASPAMLSIFAGAIDRPTAGDRAAFLDAACGADAGLRRRVEALLSAHDEAGGFLRDQLGAGSPAATIDYPLSECPGTAIGPYKLLEQIGEGGFGVVFMAEQTEPVRRKVALKVLKPGMDTRQVVARFEAERQALAIMQHPNIARVYDGGTTDACLPFFVMELVKGVPITDFCKQHQVPLRQRLELFVQVCEAIQHAHQKAVVHRDIKPSNVLVSRHDTTPVVKVIDFGVAKALGQELTDKTLHTGVAQMIGTPLYMSPEQAGMSDLDVDTRSDIYSLGVLLYELLTGTTPFKKERFKTVGYDEIRHIIREEDPPRPSTRLSTLAQAATTISTNRESDPRRLSRLFRGELDWIVMKSLEKDRTRRYETATDFGADVLRYLAGDAVQAVPPSTNYRLRKFVRRNRRTLATAALLGVALLVAVGAMAGSVGWAARDRAAQRTRTAGEVAQFLRRAESLYVAGKLPEAAAEVEMARSVLEAGHAESELERQVRQWRSDLGTSMKLEELFLVEFQNREPAPDEYARIFREYGIDVETLPPSEVAARVARSRIKSDLVVALIDWAGPVHALPEHDRERLLAIARSADPDSPLHAIPNIEGDEKALREYAKSAELKHLGRRGLVYLGYSLQRAGAPGAAVKLLLPARRQHRGDFLIATALGSARYNLNLLLNANQRWEAVIADRLAAVDLRPNSALAHSLFGSALRLGGFSESAVAACKEAVRLRPDWYLTRGNFALALTAFGDHPAAITEARTGVSLARKAASTRDIAMAYTILGNALLEGGIINEAIESYGESIRLQPSGEVFLALADAYFQKEQYDKSDAAARESVRLQPKWAKAQTVLGRAQGLQGKWDDAIASHRRATVLAPNDAEAHQWLGSALIQKRAWEEAVAAFHDALQAKPDYAIAHYNLGYAMIALGRKGEAVAAYGAAIRSKPDYWEAHDSLGWILAGMGRLDEGLAVYEKAITLAPDNLKLRFQLVRLLVAFGPDPKKWDGKRACELLAQVREVCQRDANYRWLLAVSRYRVGDNKGSIETFRKSWEFRNGHRSSDGFFLAMAYWKLGDQEAARKWYDEAAQWFESQPANPVRSFVHQRFRDEADIVLGKTGRREAAPPPRIKP